MEDLFPDEPRPVPAPTGGTWTILVETGAPPAPVRHASGYEPFVSFAIAQGADPGFLATDPSTLAAFVHANQERLDDRLRVAAGVFLGNVLAAVHPEATWQEAESPTVGTAAQRFDIGCLVESFAEDAEAGVRFGARLASWDDADARYHADAAAMDAARVVGETALLSDGPPFTRPSTAVGPLLDDAGEVVHYGDRFWNRDARPPDDAYSRVTHPERFAPLHEVATALIAHLVEHYDVRTVTTTDLDSRRVVDVRPTVGAPVRVAFTDFPGVHLRAGLLLDDRFPSCGCDACDEDAATEADRLEATVLAVVLGGYVERVPTAAANGATWLHRPDGGGTGRGVRELLAEQDRLVPAAAVEALGGEAWPAWPRRPMSEQDGSTGGAGPSAPDPPSG